MLGISQGEIVVPVVLPMAGWFPGLRNASIDQEASKQEYGGEALVRHALAECWMLRHHCKVGLGRA